MQEEKEEMDVEYGENMDVESNITFAYTCSIKECPTHGPMQNLQDDPSECLYSGCGIVPNVNVGSQRKKVRARRQAERKDIKFQVDYIRGYITLFQERVGQLKNFSESVSKKVNDGYQIISAEFNERSNGPKYQEFMNKFGKNSTHSEAVLISYYIEYIINVVRDIGTLADILLVKAATYLFDVLSYLTYLFGYILYAGFSLYGKVSTVFDDLVTYLRRAPMKELSSRFVGAISSSAYFLAKLSLLSFRICKMVGGYIFERIKSVGIAIVATTKTAIGYVGTMINNVGKALINKNIINPDTLQSYKATYESFKMRESQNNAIANTAISYGLYGAKSMWGFLGSYLGLPASASVISVPLGLYILALGISFVYAFVVYSGCISQKCEGSSIIPTSYLVLHADPCAESCFGSGIESLKYLIFPIELLGPFLDIPKISVIVECYAPIQDWLTNLRKMPYVEIPSQTVLQIKEKYTEYINVTDPLAKKWVFLATGVDVLSIA